MKACLPACASADALLLRAAGPPSEPAPGAGRRRGAATSACWIRLDGAGASEPESRRPRQPRPSRPGRAAGATCRTAGRLARTPCSPPPRQARPPPGAGAPARRAVCTRSVNRVHARREPRVRAGTRAHIRVSQPPREGSPARSIPRMPRHGTRAFLGDGRRRGPGRVCMPRAGARELLASSPRRLVASSPRRRSSRRARQPPAGAGFSASGAASGAVSPRSSSGWSRKKSLSSCGRT